ncbi:MAG: hypothetical protein J6P44_01585 [Bacteroidales bacterium]|nr:hypothetical protein [Bacteroidales bacterium]
MEQVYIKKGENAALNAFVEKICDINRIFNYIGAINIALENVLKFADSDIILSCSHHKNEICFSVQTEDDKFACISFSDTDNKDFETLFLIKMLADSVNISQEGKQIDIFFTITGIEEEITVNRKERIKAYSPVKAAVHQEKQLCL